MINRIRSIRKKKSATDLEVKVPEVPESVPEVPDVDELKEAAEEKAGDLASDVVPGDMKMLMFKMWLVEKFSCCLGTPEMSKVGAVDIPDVADVVPENPLAVLTE